MIVNLSLSPIDKNFFCIFLTCVFLSPFSDNRHGNISRPSDDLIEKYKDGNIDFDVAVTTPALMKTVSKLAKVLGPKGLMPNPKSGTVTENIEKAVKDLKHGQVIFKAEQQGIIQGTIANSGMDNAQITENLNSFIAELKRLKPASSKGIYLQDIYLSTSMGPGYRIDVSQF